MFDNYIVLYFIIMNHEWKAAGITPISIYNNKLYVLLGREARGVDNGLYDAFGGGRESEDKTPKETAVREGYEESMGFFGSKAHIRKNLKPLGPEFKHDFLLKIEYKPYSLPKLFSDVYKYTQSGVIKRKKGYFEKDIIRWFPVDKKQNQSKFRTFSKVMYKYLVENHDEILKRLS